MGRLPVRDGIIEDTPVAQCATGCRVRGQHLGDCIDPCGDDCDRRCDDHCRGCRPKRASGGLVVCRGCEGRVHRAITNAPRLVAWIRIHDVPSSGSQQDSDNIKRTKKSPPLPFRADAIDTADELHSMLAAWCQTIAEEHPGALAGPDLRGSVRSRKVLADQTGAVVGLGVQLRTWGIGHAVPRSVPTENAASWLTRQLPWALAQSFADELVREVSEAVETAGYRWPVEERPVRLPIPCDECERNSMVRYAPAYPKADPLITCTAVECGAIMDPDTYAWKAKVVADDKERADRAEKRRKTRATNDAKRKAELDAQRTA